MSIQKAVKTIPIKEFREKGYLQELNRVFLHPLGLALQVNVNEDGTEQLGCIWDYREDTEGITYDLKNRDIEGIKAFTTKANYINKQRQERYNDRIKHIGSWQEEIPSTKEE